MSADPFSEILKFTRAATLVTGGFTAGGAWAVSFPPPNKIKFFAVVKGACWVRLEGVDEPVRAETGDVLLLVARRASVLASDLSTQPVDAMQLFAGTGGKGVKLGHGHDFTHIGGHVLLDASSGRLLEDVLPPWIHIKANAPQASVLRWVLDQLVRERSDDLPGASLASAQLAQLLFIQILRAHVDSNGPLPAGWLRAVGDRRIGPVLRLMHGDPARPWHLEELAKEAAMSRTTFATHFKTVAGVAPLTYLTEWRMRLAERALREEDVPVAVLARSLGYTSESAFSNAFKRDTGTAPQRYRLAARASGVSADAIPLVGMPNLSEA